MKTILITGIEGFLGSHLAKDLASEYNIIGLSIKKSASNVYSSEENMEDIFTENNIYAVIHTAIIYRGSDESMITSNIVLPVNLYDLAKKYKVSKFLNTDTYFNNPKYQYSYLSTYTLSKKHAIEWLRAKEGVCELINMKI